MQLPRAGSNPFDAHFPFFFLSLFVLVCSDFEFLRASSLFFSARFRPKQTILYKSVAPLLFHAERIHCCSVRSQRVRAKTANDVPLTINGI